MTISTLNAWRKVYLAEAVLAAIPAGRNKRSLYQRSVKVTLVSGAILWLMHDLAHGRWHVAIADVIALLGRLSGQSLVTLGGVVYAVANPEEPPSPFIWSR
ncbi:MAG: hypothetical protein ACHQ7M_03500 [Chloroflexota bacterium]